MSAMTKVEQLTHEAVTSLVRASFACIATLPEPYDDDEDLRAAAARLSDWLSDNAGRWTR